MSNNTSAEKVTTEYLCQMKRDGRKIAAITAYDYSTAKLADESSMDIVLVGDSLGPTVLGYPNTIPVTLDQSLHHTAAVVRGVARAMVIGDMPFMTYQTGTEQALKNAARYLQEAGADAVKLEGGESIAPTVQRLVTSGVPVLGHIGILPQSLLTEGRYRVQGRGQEEADQLRRDAKALEEAGAFAVVFEGMPLELSRTITAELSIPTIGIGAGCYCDGQIQVVHDLLGLTEESETPRHAKQYADLAVQTRKAFDKYIDEVKNSRFPDDQHSFK